MTSAPSWADEPTEEYEPVTAPLLTPGQQYRAGPPASEDDWWMTADERLIEYARWRRRVREDQGDGHDVQE